MSNAHWTQPPTGEYQHRDSATVRHAVYLMQVHPISLFSVYILGECS